MKRNVEDCWTLTFCKQITKDDYEINKQDLNGKDDHENLYH